MGLEVALVVDVSTVYVYASPSNLITFCTVLCIRGCRQPGSLWHKHMGFSYWNYVNFDQSLHHRTTSSKKSHFQMWLIHVPRFRRLASLARLSYEIITADCILAPRTRVCCVCVILELKEYRFSLKLLKMCHLVIIHKRLTNF